MADNFAFTEGTGKTGAADDIGGVLHPRVKVGWGPDGTFNDADIATGKALPVQLRDASGNVVAPLTESDFDTKIGSLTETAPATDTASSGLNGRLQRIAQRITSFIALIPAALTGSGNFKVSLQESNASQATTTVDGGSVTLGSKADAKSTATDTTSISIMSVLKQISASIQAAATSLAGTLVVAAHHVTNAGTFAVQATEADGANTTLGSKADAKSTATDTTAITVMQVLKQISASIQAAAASLAGSLTVATHAVTQSGTWTVQPGNTANTTAWKVDGSAVTQPVSAASLPLPTGASSSAKQDTQITAEQAIQTSVELIDDVVKADDAGFTPGTTKVLMVGFEADESSTDSIDEGDAGAARITLDRKQIVTEQPHTAGGLTMSKTVSAASTNATSVKASAGKVYAIQASNVNAASRYLKLYNKASAPTVGSDTPVKTLIIPGNAAGAGTNIVFPTGIEFATGIAFALTTEATDAGSTGVAASEIVVNIDYK